MLTTGLYNNEFITEMGSPLLTSLIKDAMSQSLSWFKTSLATWAVSGWSLSFIPSMAIRFVALNERDCFYCLILINSQYFNGFYFFQKLFLDDKKINLRKKMWSAFLWWKHLVKSRLVHLYLFKGLRLSIFASFQELFWI